MHVRAAVSRHDRGSSARWLQLLTLSGRQPMKLGRVVPGGKPVPSVRPLSTASSISRMPSCTPVLICGCRGRRVLQRTFRQSRSCVRVLQRSCTRRCMLSDVTRGLRKGALLPARPRHLVFIEGGSAVIEANTFIVRPRCVPTLAFLPYMQRAFPLSNDGPRNPRWSVREPRLRFRP